MQVENEYGFTGKPYVGVDHGYSLPDLGSNMALGLGVGIPWVK